MRKKERVSTIVNGLLCSVCCVALAGGIGIGCKEEPAKPAAPQKKSSGEQDLNKMKRDAKDSIKKDQPAKSTAPKPGVQPKASTPAPAKSSAQPAPIAAPAPAASAKPAEPTADELAKRKAAAEAEIKAKEMEAKAKAEDAAKSAATQLTPAAPAKPAQ
jgi:hypothetical protein